MKKKNRILKKALVLLISLILFQIITSTNIQSSFIIQSQTFQAPVIYVDYDYGNGILDDDNNNDLIDATHKKTIQEGINAVDNNGTVFVCEVTSNSQQYRENVIINKPLNLKALAWVRIDGTNTSHTITINANNVTIEKFMIINGTDGIHSEGYNKINILANVIYQNNEEGIEFVNCGAPVAPVIIIGNLIENNEHNGIFLNNSQYVTINSNPSIVSNGLGGDNRYTRSNIMLEKCRWVTISDNPQIENSDFIGIFIVKESENITVINNTITNSGDDGIDCKYSPYGVDNPNWPNNVKIINNTITQSTDEQIHIYSGKNILLQKNTIQNGQMTGITIDSGSGTNIKIFHNTIEGNGITGPDWFAGILLCGQYSIMVINNSVENNQGEGIFIYSDSGNSNNNHIIEENKVRWNNWDGICIKNYTSHNNIIRNNTVVMNGAVGGDYYGIRIMGASNNNKIYHNNIIENNKQAFDEGNNIWDNDYPSAGNYWSNFNEPSEGANDTSHGVNQDKNSSDGIVDKGGTTGGLNPYNIPGGINKDTYPVMKQNGWINNKPNIPEIKGPDKGKPRTNYEYKCSASDPEGYKLYFWIDWGDGTNSGWIGPYNSGEEIIVKHTWNKKGSYNVKVKVKDTGDSESEWASLIVTIPYSYDIPIQSLLQKFFERFPHAFPILRHFMGY